MREFLRDRNGENQGLFNYSRWHATWGKVIRISYGVIFNKECAEIPKAREIADVLDEIAVINVKKIPGGSKANHKEMWKHFHQNKELLNKEIDTINPEVIICGGTLHFFEKEGGLSFTNGRNNWGGKANDGRYWIDGYHPSYYKCTDDEYMTGVQSVLI